MKGESERGFSYEVLLVNHIALSTAVGGSQMLLRLFFTTRDVTQLLHQVVVRTFLCNPPDRLSSFPTLSKLAQIQLTTLTISKIPIVTRPQQKT